MIQISRHRIRNLKRSSRGPHTMMLVTTLHRSLPSAIISLAWGLISPLRPLHLQLSSQSFHLLNTAPLHLCPLGSSFLSCHLTNHSISALDFNYTSHLFLVKKIVMAEITGAAASSGPKYYFSSRKWKWLILCSCTSGGYRKAQGTI